MIKDEIQISLSSGRGGNGGVKFSKGTTKMPQGGFGGDGGNVYLEGAGDLYDYHYMNDNFQFVAEDGQTGGVNQQRGKNGKDLIIKVPLVTEVYDEEGKLVIRVDKKGEQILFLKGGQGGIGNHYFRRGFEGKFDHSTPGKPAEVLKVSLQMKLVADIVFIGFPNAGKSSLLNALTNTSVKVGSYPFTTLSPHLGRMGKVNPVTLMDLPGLIEGTAKGKGLGTGFLKHTEFSNIIAHLISLESADLLKDYNIIRNELSEISENLSQKPEILVLSKRDMFSEEEIVEKLNELKSIKIPKIIISTFNMESLAELEKVFRTALRTVEQENKIRDEEKALSEAKAAELLLQKKSKEKTYNVKNVSRRRSSRTKID